MEIKDDITRRKIELTIEILQAALQGKDIEFNSRSDKGWVKIDNIRVICPSIIESYRIANNYRPCDTKHEFIQLMEYHVHNLTIKETNTQYLYSIINVCETYVMLNRQDGTGSVPVTFKKLFDNFTIKNEKEYIIGIKINNNEEQWI